MKALPNSMDKLERMAREIKERLKKRRATPMGGGYSASPSFLSLRAVASSPSATTFPSSS
ncbi:hypothetical protein HpDR12_14210 [Helicobacter pylori]